MALSMKNHFDLKNIRSITPVLVIRYNLVINSEISLIINLVNYIAFVINLVIRYNLYLILTKNWTGII